MAPPEMQEGCPRWPPGDRYYPQRAAARHGGGYTWRAHSVLKHPTYNLLHGRFSPDNRWVSFTARIQPNRVRIAIAPVDGPKPVPESAWIIMAETGPDELTPAFQETMCRFVGADVKSATG